MKLVFDGSHLLYRSAFVAFSNENSKMASVGGILFVFMRTLMSSLDRFYATGAIVFWDEDHGNSHRLAILPQYKGTRSKEETPQRIAMRHARGLLKIILPKLRIINYGSSFAEADDLAFLVSKYLNNCILVSEDYDWMQSITPSNTLYRPIADETYNYQYMIDNYFGSEFDPIEVFKYVKAIVGDGSDNIPQVKFRVGEVTAKKAVRQMMLGEPMIKDLDSLREQININYRVIDMSWILQRSSEVISDIKSQISRLSTSLELADWIDVVNKLQSPSLMSKYDTYANFVQRANYSELENL